MEPYANYCSTGICYMTTLADAHAWVMIFLENSYWDCSKYSWCNTIYTTMEINCEDKKLKRLVWWVISRLTLVIMRWIYIYKKTAVILQRKLLNVTANYKLVRERCARMGQHTYAFVSEKFQRYCDSRSFV